MRPALPERASARPVLQRRGPGEFRAPDGRGGEDQDGGVGRRQRGLQAVPGGKHDLREWCVFRVSHIHIYIYLDQAHHFAPPR